MKEARVSLITGANRGIGLAVAKSLAAQGDLVLLGCRDLAKARETISLLGGDSSRLVAWEIDVSNDDSVARSTTQLLSTYKRVDVLVNNAGVLLDPPRNPPDAEGASIFSAKLATVRSSFEVNTLGALRLAQALIPAMKRRGYGRVVNVSSGMGQLAEMNGGWPGYRLSKLALNGLTRILADELQGTDVLVNSVCPGWVRTDMGGAEADLSPDEGADTIVWLANLPAGGPSGKFFRERAEIPW
jgi:NAD(P)-dependent dehydrogenase (short-subunit alcohol dehydrogenase family)